MRVTGYCERCHRIRTVRVTSAGMARLTQGKVAVGVCGVCQEKDATERRKRNG